MRYWFFDGKSPTGPYEEEDLKKIPGFNSKSLICPESAQTSNQWKAAQYYLIKPPSQKSNESAKLPERTRMGRLAEIEDAEEKKARESHAEQEAVALRRVTPKKIWWKVFVFSCLAASVIYFLPKIRLLVHFSQESRPAAPTPSSSDSVLAEQAIQVVKDFPLRTDPDKYPSRIEDILSPGKWKSPKTMGELLEMRSLREFAFQTAAFLKMAGLSPQSAKSAIVKDPNRWGEWARTRVARSFDFQWSASPMTGSHYQVTATAPEAWSLAGRREVFEADIQAQTLKPLNFNAWYDLDAKALSHWSLQNIEWGKDIDDLALSQAAPTYSSRDFKLKKNSPRKKALPVLKAASHKTIPSHQRSVSHVEKSPTPATQHSPALPASSPTPSTTATPNPSADHKSAKDMSVDELNRYLKRGKTSDQSPNPQ